MTTQYKIRFHLGIGDNYQPIYSYAEVNSEVYTQLKQSTELFQFLVKTERAYEHIIENYHDFEENNFSIILNNELYQYNTANQFRGEYNSFVKHLLNLLTSTYLYTSVLKIIRKDETKKNEEGEFDFSFKNSKDIRDIYDLKFPFKETTNAFHQTRYQYTLVSALRNQ